MKPFKKVVLIGTQPEHTSRGTPVAAGVYCTIEVKPYDKDPTQFALSITGVIGPSRTGDAWGACGQCYDSIACDKYYYPEYLDAKQTPTGWDLDMQTKFIEIWKEWHMNDVQPHTVDMKEAGWCEQVDKIIYKYEYWLSDASEKRLAVLEKNSINAALEDTSFALTEEEKRLIRLTRTYASRAIYAYEEPETPEFLERSRESGKVKPPTKCTLGWVSNKDHPDGLLGKELNGSRYGSAWYFHPIPEEVLQWLYDLPDALIPMPGAWAK